MTYILIIYIYAGMLSSGDSVAITNVPGFTSEASCEAAAKQAQKLASNTFKEARTVCLEQPR